MCYLFTWVQNLSTWSKKYVEVDAFVEKWPLVGSGACMERKLGHVTLATNRTKILHSLYGFKMVTSSYMLTCIARFLRLSVVKGGC